MEQLVSIVIKFNLIFQGSIVEVEKRSFFYMCVIEDSWFSKCVIECFINSDVIVVNGCSIIVDCLVGINQIVIKDILEKYIEIKVFLG